MPSEEPDRNDTRAGILEYIGPGSATKATLVDVLGDEHGETQVKVELMDLIDEGELVEHPEIDGAWMKP